MTTLASLGPSLPPHGLSRPPPPRPQLLPSAAATGGRDATQAAGRPFVGHAALSSSPPLQSTAASRRASAGSTDVSSSARALQLLRETRPPPPRRQSVPAGVPLPPRGAPPLPSIEKRASPGMVLGKYSSLNAAVNPSSPINTVARVSPLTGKPAPPTTQPPMSAIAAARRHSTGNADGNTNTFGAGIGLGGTVAGTATRRPPPPRGPPPSVRAPTSAAVPGLHEGISNGTNAHVPLAVAQTVRRRSSDGLVRGPPAGPPPPGRRLSAVTSIPQQHEPSSQDLSTAINTAGPGKRRSTGEVISTTAISNGIIPNIGANSSPNSGATASTIEKQHMPEENPSRRVSFSAYRGPREADQAVTSEGRNVGLGINIEGTVDGIVGGSGDPLANKPLPQLQRRRSSQTGGALGRPPPPRPPGAPPAAAAAAADQVRRYSISNEISDGLGNFSRRMSMVPEATPGFAAAATSAPKAAGTNTTSNVVETPGKNTNIYNDDDHQQQQQQPSVRVENGGKQIAIGQRQTSHSGAILAPSGMPVRGGNGNPPHGEAVAQPPPEGRAAVLWYNMGVTRQKERDGKGAVECYSRAAAEGHAKAQHNLAAIYEKGVPGVAKDEPEAVRLFQLAADQGLAESCYSLAMHLKFGLGIDADDARCVYYLEKASEQGLAKAIFNLGLMYEKRRGISPEAPENGLLEATRECYHAAAEAGVTKAAVNLGVLYLTGRFSGRDPGEALEWFKKAADAGDVSGLWNLSLCYERGVGVARDPIAAQALQQQCREREQKQKQQQQQQQQQQRQQPHTGASGVVGGECAVDVGSNGTRRRSSDPLAAVTSPVHPVSIGGTTANSRLPSGASNYPAGAAYSPAGANSNFAMQSSRRHSSSLPVHSGIIPAPGATGPPQFSLPNKIPDTDNNHNNNDSSYNTQNIKRRSSATAAPSLQVPNKSETGQGGINAGTTSPETRGNCHITPSAAVAAGVERRHSATGKDVVGDVARRGVNWDESMPVGDAGRRVVARGPDDVAVSGGIPPPPQRERKDSLLLKPTPLAIARVKAAVERRRAMEAAAAAAAAGTVASASSTAPTG